MQRTTMFVICVTEIRRRNCESAAHTTTGGMTWAGGNEHVSCHPEQASVTSEMCISPMLVWHSRPRLWLKEGAALPYCRPVRDGMIVAQHLQCWEKRKQEQYHSAEGRSRNVVERQLDQFDSSEALRVSCAPKPRSAHRPCLCGTPRSPGDPAFGLPGWTAALGCG